MLKLYSIDYGWEGSLVVVAKTVEEAVEVMNREWDRLREPITVQDVQEYEIVQGLVIQGVGE